ncbi:MAG: flagellar filament capping protein FliD [Candidatus Latescibacteria bacterium]|nr:flagellar filament capping protein FliD [Candidatus Latescibacterota bacterium]
MSTISFGGLSSGLDTGKIVAQLLAIRRQPIDRLETQKTMYSKTKIALQGVESRVRGLMEAAGALDSNDEFASLSATSSHEALLTATAGALASPGGYDIVVTTRAQAQKERSQGFDAPSTSVGTGTFSITVGGQTTDIQMIAGSSGLADLASAINDSAAGVSATVLYDGSETGGYYLSLTAEETGTAAAFTVDASGLTGGTAPTFGNVQQAQNAAFTIDGLPVVSQTNTVTTAIQGVTLNLAGVDAATTVHLDVATDGAAIEAKVQAFVDAYNDLFGYIAEQGGEEGVLRGDGTLRSVVAKIRTDITSRLSDGPITMLYQVGIRQTEGGDLSFDTSAFQRELAGDYAAVRDLFISRAGHDGTVSKLGESLDTMLDSVDGVFKLRSAAIDDRVSSIDDTIARYERSVDSYEKTLNARFTAMESLLSTLQAQSGYLSAITTNSSS